MMLKGVQPHIECIGGDTIKAWSSWMACGIYKLDIIRWIETYVFKSDIISIKSKVLHARPIKFKTCGPKEYEEKNNLSIVQGTL